MRDWFRKFKLRKEIKRVEKIIKHLEDIQNESKSSRMSFADVSTLLYNFIDKTHQGFLAEDLRYLSGTTLKVRSRTSTDFETFFMSLDEYDQLRYRTEVGSYAGNFPIEERYFGDWYDGVNGINVILNNRLPRMLLVYIYSNKYRNTFVMEENLVAENTEFTSEDIEKDAAIVKNVLLQSPGYEYFTEHRDLKAVVDECLSIFIAAYSVKLRGLREE